MSPTIRRREKRRGPWLRVDPDYDSSSDSLNTPYKEYHGVSEEFGGISEEFGGISEELGGLASEAAAFADDETCGC
jgi:hypothetical protein